MRGGHGDNYYLQLVANVRRYKGAPALPAASGPASIRIAGDFRAWDAVEPVFTDAVDDTAPRDHRGVLSLHYRNATGRNDILAARVARDRQHVFFHVRTREPLTPPTDPHWMWLFLDLDQSRATGWEGYDLVVNRSIGLDGTTWLERNTGGWNWEKVARIEYRAAGTELRLAIPRRALGLPEGETQVALDFKWVDNPQKPGDILDWYVNGDVAPEGRFNFRYAAP